MVPPKDEDGGGVEMAVDGLNAKLSKAMLEPTNNAYMVAGRDAGRGPSPRWEISRVTLLVRRMQCQIMCTGCRNILVYPRGATNVCCAVCNTITSVPPSGTEVAQLICGCCRTMLMHVRGASNVKCPCCDTVNLVREANRVAHIDCGQCRTTLMYPYGAVSVKCTICHFITDVRMSNLRVPFHRANGATTMMRAPTSAAHPPARETVLVENPMSLDANGNLVTNVVVGVGRKQM